MDGFAFYAAFVGAFFMFTAYCHLNVGLKKDQGSHKDVFREAYIYMKMSAFAFLLAFAFQYVGWRMPPRVPYSTVENEPY